MKKWQRLLLTLAVALIGLALFLAGWAIYAHFTAKPLASCLKEERGADLCQIRWHYTNLDARELELTGEGLEEFWAYLNTVQVSPALRSRNYKLAGNNYYIAFYKQDKQLAELILSPAGELVVIRGGRRYDYQVRLTDGERLVLPLDRWEPA